MRSAQTKNRPFVAENTTQSTGGISGGLLYSALSRSDGVTAICPDCGKREALESIGVAEEEQEKILDIIHQTYGAR